LELSVEHTNLAIERRYEWDARDQLLPPCWVQRNDASIDPERGMKDTSRILVSGPSGQLRKRLLSTIGEAREVVCLASFLLADVEIVRAVLGAAERGCRVYLLTASEGQLLKEPREDSEFDNQRREEHAKLLRELAGHVLVRSADSFHSKFLLIDPRTRNARGFLLTANLTTEALMRNPEMAVELHRDEAQDLFRQFLAGFWEESQNELLGPDRLSLVRPPVDDGQWTAPKILLCTTRRLKTIKQAMLNLIERADSEIILSTFGIDSQHPVTQSLLKAMSEGKRVRILARPRASKTTMTALLLLAKADAEVRGHQWLHAKSLLIDHNGSWEGMIMTSNVEQRGLDEGFETGILLQGDDARRLHDLLEIWWKELPLKLSLSTKLGEVEGPVQVWLEDRSLRVSVEKQGEINLGEMDAKSPEDMQRAIPVSFRKPSLPRDSTLYHKILYTWRTSTKPFERGSERH
jgi:cardiolipin synthase